MKKFVLGFLIALVAVLGVFVAVGVFLARCKKAIDIKPKKFSVSPKKKVCEEAVCAVDQCMPF